MSIQYGLIRVPAGHVRQWKQQWPCSGLPDASIDFEFQDGDLVDVRCPDGDLTGADVSGALAALSQDAQARIVGHMVDWQ